MKASTRIFILATLAVVVAGAAVLKRRQAAPRADDAAQARAVVGTAVDRPQAGPMPGTSAELPRLIDLGADKCIPCRAMAPILEGLKREYAGRMDVEFIDVWKNPDAGKQYGIELIPTQIFYDGNGKELFRHQGFYGKEDILGKWKELGVDLSGGTVSTGIVRETPVVVDTRPRESVCSMCDEPVNPRTRTIVRGQTEQRVFCGPHCCFIYFSSIVDVDLKAEEIKVSVTDWASGRLVAATTAHYLHGLDAKGRPTVKAFADRDAASREQQTSPGNIIGWEVLRSKELATRCTFCDRAVYPEDACAVTFGSAHGYGCCTHCALGVAARLKQDIEIEARDGLTGDLIRVKTFDGQIASFEPATAVAWFGQKQNTEGQWVSAGCFKQGFFSNQDNLRKWLESRPAMTGREITIAQALADKMKLTPEQIAKACKLGECK
jgi:thioredoxin 1